MKTVNFCDVEYPWRMTILGLETFCDKSGIELSEYSQTVTKLNTKTIKNLIWSGMVGGCKKQGVAIGLSYEEFVDKANDFDYDELTAILPKEKNDLAPESGANS